MTNNDTNINSSSIKRVSNNNKAATYVNQTSSSPQTNRSNRDGDDIAKILNEKNELIELNNRLGNYINSVKDLTLNKNNISNNSNNNSEYGLSYSMKNLEKDLDRLKQLYANEFRQMRAEIEELSGFKNRYALENYNLELKLKDFIVKFEDVKKTNQDLMNELNEVRVRNNQIEFEIESKKLEADKPHRENKQLKKDLDDLIEKLNEKQAISDNEIAYRQDLESKYKELADLNSFERKVHEQEIENLKSQLKLSHEAINNLELRLNELNENESSIAKNYETEYDKLLNEIDALKLRNTQLEEQNETLKNTCQNLENVISNLEEIKNNLEEKIALNNNYNQNNKNTNFNNDLINKTRQTQQSRMSLINPTNYLDLNDNNQLMSKSTGESGKQDTSIKFSDVNEYFNFDTDYNISNDPSSVMNANVPQQQHQQQQQQQQQQHKYTSSLNHFIQQQQEQQKLDKQNNELSQMKKRQIHINNNIETTNNSSRILSFLPGNSMSSPNIFSPPSSTSISSHSISNQNNKTKPSNNNNNNNNINNITSSNIIVGGPINSLSYIENKDFTNDLFKNFEKEIFSNNNISKQRDKSNSSQLSSIDNHVTEASYVGNVKIHEVNKNGYYVRLLNVSNTVDEDLSNFSLQQIVATMPVAVYRLPPATKLLPGHTLTVWARTDEVQQQPPHTFVWQEQDRWGTGPECTTILSKPNGQAVSWTTGCHKYGNIDYDEILPVYTQRRQKSAQIQLNRDKLLPQSIFMPTKHPHANNLLKSTDTLQTITSNSALSASSFANNNNNLNACSSSKLSNNYDLINHQNNYTAFQKSFFSTNQQRTNNNKSALSSATSTNSNKIVSLVK